MRLDREERALRVLKETLGNKTKRKLERACDGGGWITVLPRSQDGTDLSREEFRDALWCSLDPPPQNTPITCDGCRNLFTVDHTCHCKIGGIVGLRHNLLKN